jgi:hypothetical protein
MKTTTFLALAALTFAVTVSTPAFSQPTAGAPAGGWQRCVNAGNTPAYCTQRGKDIAAGKIKPDPNFGRGTAKGAPKVVPAKNKQQ